ncbi:MAG TPA: hypothetical protein VJ508_03125, partial [Saprospiraceae bacterium]|nr:hypothetical protein [Saprospiraceae bacterium]
QELKLPAMYISAFAGVDAGMEVMVMVNCAPRTFHDNKQAIHHNNRICFIRSMSNISLKVISTNKKGVIAHTFSFLY